jgi:hypothetical protein
VGEKEDPNEVRARLDSELGVTEWRATDRRRPPRAPIEPGAPSWWHGDEEASQSFLRDRGVRL